MTVALPAPEEVEAVGLQAVRMKDPLAFEEFVRRNDRWVRGVIFAVLGSSDRVDDVCQQVWSRVWGQISTLRDDRSWRTWLYQMSRNAALDAVRETARRRELNESFRVRREERMGDSEASSPDVETRQLIQDAIRSLPVLYRETFVLRHVQDWSYRQIGEVLGISEEAVETRLVRARRQLREALAGKFVGVEKV